MSKKNQDQNRLAAEMRVKKWFGKEQDFQEARKAAIELHLKIRKKFNEGDYFFRLALYPKMEEASKQVMEYNQAFEDLRLLGRI